MSDRQILVIDDEQDRLDQLSEAIRQEVKNVTVQGWKPERVKDRTDDDPLVRFESLVESPTGLIVTDHDLTRGGTGLLGSNITAWAQDRFIPVCNFSRQPKRKLPRESNFFELRVPTEPEERARAHYIARVYRGFGTIRSYVSNQKDGALPTAAILAEAIGQPQLQDALAPYLASASYANSAFMRTVRDSGGVPSGQMRIDFLTFILGHVLLNAVLEFPGPILSRSVLAAYCAMGEGESGRLAELFAEAQYSGPFSAPGEFFLRDAVDERIDVLNRQEMAIADNGDGDGLEVDEYNRQVVLSVLESVGTPHSCKRCHGARGGLWCPFLKRAVCNREECSVSSNAWIPRGATLCRVERDYYDEWAPLLLSE